MLLVHAWTLFRICNRNFDTFGNDDQLLVQHRWFWSRCSHSILDALYQEQEVNDEEWDESIGGKLL